MLKISRGVSVYISLALTALMFTGAVIMSFYVPAFSDTLFALSEKSGALSGTVLFSRAALLCVGYAELFLMALGLVLLFALLILVQKRKVFTETAVELIRYISWCLIIMGAVMLSLSFYSLVALFVGAAVFFVGLTVRVVKNVIEEAVYLKKENDLTV